MILQLKVGWTMLSWELKIELGNHRNNNKYQIQNALQFFSFFVNSSAIHTKVMHFSIITLSSLNKEPPNPRNDTNYRNPEHRDQHSDH